MPPADDLRSTISRHSAQRNLADTAQTTLRPAAAISGPDARLVSIPDDMADPKATGVVTLPHRCLLERPYHRTYGLAVPVDRA
jgi:hypothetical protein